MSVVDLLTLVATWSSVTLSPARDAVLAEVEEAAQVAADADGTVRLSQHVQVHRFRRA